MSAMKSTIVPLRRHVTTQLGPTSAHATSATTAAASFAQI